MKKNIFYSLGMVFILIIFLFLTVSSQAINIKDYIKGKLPSIFSFYLSSLEDLDSYEKEFIDLLEKLPEEEQEYYAKEVYKNGFSLELLEKLKKGEKFEEPTLDWSKIKEPYQGTKEEKPMESLPSLIKRIKPSTVIIFAYDDKGEFLKLGSGFFISQNGDVITNYHLIQGASSAEIKTADEKTYPITYILAGDEPNDLIRLSVNIPSQEVYPLSLSQTIPEVGERIIVYGSPLGLENTVSDGIVSAIRDIPDYGRIIQITAPISPGSSGSPVLNMQGEVIGIASFQMVEGQNLNFAIPSEKIANLNLKEEKKISTSEELFGQESKAKEDSDFYTEAYQKALYFINDKEEYEKALPYLEIAIKADILSLKEDVYFYIGFCNDNMGNYSKAIEAYKQAISINPDYAYTYYFLGSAYYSLSLYKESIEAYKQGTRIEPPNNAIVYYNIGLACDSLSLYKDAIEAYKQSIRIDPDDAESYNNLGFDYYNLSLYKDAIEAYKQAISINPDYVKPHFFLGISYHLIGDKSSALDEYKILKNLDINFANDLFGMIY
jgi:S1-C subfamily serine protease/Tfp pilus assembly protein PilF